MDAGASCGDDNGPPFTVQGSADASNRVFSTTELLEAILLQLPVKHVLLAQRVSKQWCSTVVGSVQLQTALCFRPVRLVSADDLPDGHLELAKRCRAPRYASCAAPLVTAYEFLASAKQAEKPVTNPLLTHLLSPTKEATLEDRFAATFAFDPLTLKGSYIAAAPWSRMYLTQPPVTRLLLLKELGLAHAELPAEPVLGSSLFVETEGMLHVGFLGVMFDVIDNEVGVTVGDLVEHANGRWAREDGYCVRSTWVT
ncbi:hypothetical protein LTR85_008905 [Meristemomyces frigidus]|nr:hypothetical protein LTR85_008905 [Meristemomyces frigidus]